MEIFIIAWMYLWNIPFFAVAFGVTNPELSTTARIIVGLFWPVIIPLSIIRSAIEH